MDEAWNVLLVAILAQVSPDTGSCHPIETYGLLTLQTDDSVLLDKHLSQAARAHTNLPLAALLLLSWPLL